MNEAIENLIKLLTDKIVTTGLTCDEALKFSQAALNLAHVEGTLANADNLRRVDFPPPI